MLIDDNQYLTGLFTDSDLARLLEQNKESCFDTAICLSMTSDPICVQSHQMLTVPLRFLLNAESVNFPVVNESYQPVGMIDITDTVALLLPVKPRPTPLFHSQTFRPDKHECQNLLV